MEEARENAPYGLEIPPLSLEEELYLYLNMLEERQGVLKDFLSLLSGVSNSDWQLMISSLDGESSLVQNLTSEQLLSWIQEENREELQRLRNEMKIINERVNKMGALIAFAEYARRYQFTPATYDADAPAGYNEGFNFAREMSEQVSNPSTADVPCVVLTGSNMSGKSYNLVQDLFIQLLGQSFGWVPAQEANLRIYRHIVYIDRADTEATRNLSAFGSEIVDKWKRLIEIGDDSTIVFVDEGFSTTSPEDQEALLYASITTLLGRGVRFKIATHNEGFINRVRDDPRFRFYHFQIMIPPDGGDVEFTYRLQEGIGDSQAIDIASNQGMPEYILASAQRYLEGDVVSLSEEGISLPQILPLVSYTPEEIQYLKEQPRSFIHFFPYGTDFIVEHDFEGKEFRARYDIDDKEYHSDLHPGPLFSCYSQDEDFSKWGGISSVKYEDIPSGFLENIQQMLLWGATYNSQELLARQEMFEELSNYEQLQGLIQKVRDLGEQLILLVRIGEFHNHFRDFNIYLIQQSAEIVCDHWWSFDDTFLKDLDSFFKMLDFVFKVSGINKKGLNISENLDIIFQLLGLETRYSGLLREEIPRDEFRRRRDELVRQFVHLIGGEVREDEFGFMDIYDRDGNKVGFYEGCVRGIQQKVKQIADEVISHLEPLAIFDVDEEVLKTELARVVPQLESVYLQEGKARPFYVTFLRIINTLLNGKNLRLELVQDLAGFNSLYLNQIGHYLDGLLDVFFQGFSTPYDIWEGLKAHEAQISQVKDDIQNVDRILQDEEKVVELRERYLSELNSCLLYTSPSPRD